MPERSKEMEELIAAKAELDKINQEAWHWVDGNEVIGAEAIADIDEMTRAHDRFNLALKVFAERMKGARIE